MFTVMLCGASDTRQISTAFESTIRGFGGEALWYQSGRISYLNGPDSSWALNSRRTVSSSDLCVFVIVEHFGEITWSAELDEALTGGVPFIILCLRSTYDEYNILRQNRLFEAIDYGEKKNLVAVLMQIESERQLTVVPFDMTSFSSVLQQQVSLLIKLSLKHLSERSKRNALHKALHASARLTPVELDLAEQIAVDEFEERGRRVLALKAIATRGTATTSTIARLVASPERDVQRAAFDYLPTLCPTSFDDLGFLEECVSIANITDDVGISRRLIPAIFKIDPTLAITALSNLDLTEIGSRRRLAAALEEAKTAVFDNPLVRETAVSLLRRCTEKSTKDSGWLGRAQMLLKQYEGEGQEI